MNIRMYNVQFGDSFLLQEDNDSLLIDFGSDTPCALSNAEKDIIASCKGKELSILLTHFHKDHINGLWETQLPGNVTVNQVYIPDIFAMRVRSATKLDFVQLHVLSDIFSSLVLQHRPIHINLYSLLKGLINVNSKIILLRRGASFSVASRKYQVLWPNFDKLGIDPRVEKPVLSILTKIDILPNDFHTSAEHVRIPYVDEFIDKLLDAYMVLLEGNTEDTVALQEVNSAFRRMSEFFEGENRIHMPEAVEKEIKDRLHSMRNQENKISIVFQDRATDTGSKMLMTGDITAANFRKILRMQEISDEYKIIKAPHHGTDSHFLQTLPKCERILISNGDPLPCHSRWGKISYLYGGFYGSNQNRHMVCTNTRCELRHMPNTISCTPCQGHSSYIDIPLS